MKRLLFFSFFWVFSCLIWPIWLMPETFSSRLFFFFTLILYIAINIFLLKLWVKSIKAEKQKFEFKLNNKSIIALIFFYIIFILINLYLIRFPITISDGAGYVSRGLALYKIIDAFVSKFVPFTIISWFFVVVALVIFFLRKKIINYLKPLRKYRKKLFIIFIFVFFIGFLFYFLSINNLIYNSSLLKDTGMVSSHLSDDTQSKITSSFYIFLRYVVREGPFNTIIEALMISLFGLNEWALRIHSLLFSLLAGLYMYRILLLFRNSKTALLASIMLLFIPGFFYFTHLAYKEAGLMFFICASSFYLLRYSKMKNKNDLITASFLIGIGYLYKDPVLFLIPIFWASWLIHFIISKKSINIFNLLKQSKDKLIFTWFSLVPIIPWFISTLIWRKLYEAVLSISDFTQKSLIKYIVISMPYDLGLVLYFVFFIAFVYALYRIIKKNEILLTVAIITFIVINIVYSFGDPIWGAFQRWYVPALFGIVILLSVFIGDVLLRTAKSRIAYWVIIVICILLVIQSLILTMENLNVQYLPFDETFKHIKENIPEDKKILATMGPNPYKFYIEKYNIKNELDHTEWVIPAEKQNITNLYEYCKENNISYVLFPYPRPLYLYYVRTKGNPLYLKKPYDTWFFQSVNTFMVAEMKESLSEHFILEKSFKLGHNEMMLFRINLHT